MPCTCALKRESGIDDLQKSATLNAARTHRRAHSYGKPVMSRHGSDIAMPSRPMQSLRPPLHRHNNSAHESTYPYTIKQFTSSTPDINAMQNSHNNHLQPLFRPASVPRSSQSTSDLPQFSGPLSEADALATETMPMTDSPAPTPTFNYSLGEAYASSDGVASSPLGPEKNDFQPAYDPSFTRNSLSAGNPSRYSVNDFSDLNWPTFNNINQFYSQPAYSASAAQLSVPGSLYNHPSFAASTGQLQPELSIWNEHVSDAGHDSSNMQTPQRSSMISLDHPGLTHSPSNTVSDVDSTAYHSDALSGQNARISANMKPSWSMGDAIDPQTIENTSNQAHASLPMADLSLAHRPRPEELQHDHLGYDGGIMRQDMGSDSPTVTTPTIMYSGDYNGSGLIDLDESVEVSNFTPGPDMSIDNDIWEKYTNDPGYEQQNFGISLQGDDSNWRQ